jgi:hypothetical protein
MAGTPDVPEHHLLNTANARKSDLLRELTEHGLYDQNAAENLMRLPGTPEGVADSGGALHNGGHVQSYYGLVKTGLDGIQGEFRADLDAGIPRDQALANAAKKIVGLQNYLREGLSGANTDVPPIALQNIDPRAGDAWLKCQTARDGEALTIITTGMAPFIEREIELTSTKLTLAEAVKRTYELCNYLIRQGLVVKDGDTAELDPGVKSRMHFRPQGRLPGLPVLQLTLGVA